MGGFLFLSLFYAFLGLRFLVGFWPKRKIIFSPPLTPEKRRYLAEAAFFILIPVSVALHELGHAIAIKLYGGEIEGFGFYFFAGYVSYDPTGMSDLQMMVIAFAGTLVNVVMILGALAVVYWKPISYSHATNELLLQFAIVSALNSLIFYPLMDLVFDLSGDWSQMYRGGVPWFTAVIVAVQVGTLILFWWLSRNSKARRRLAYRTGLGAYAERGLLARTA